MGLRITTWNVNGIRNPFGYQPWSKNKTFDAMFEILGSDIVVMQELKIQRKDLSDDMVLVPGWDCFFSLPKHKKGYSGVGIYTRQSICQPIRAEEGLLGVLCPPGSSTTYRDLPEDEAIGGYPSYSELVDLDIDPAALDAEGRCVVVEFPAFVLFGLYCPANTRGDEMGTHFRHTFWKALDIRIRRLDRMGKRVVVTGDLNNAKCELDIAGAEDDKKKEGVTHVEYVSTPNRRILNQLLEDGEVFGPRDEGRENPVLWDACRAFHPKRQGMYTHWDTKKNARPGNYGSRIDYVLVSLSMESWITDSNIQEGLLGSDHCPVYANLDDKVLVGETTVDIKDIMNPAGVFKDGQRLQEIPTKATLAFSARLLPEFNVGQRRNIKDMFKRQPSNATTMMSSQLSQSSQTASPSKPISLVASPTARLLTQTTAASDFAAPQSPSKVPATKRKPTDANGSKAKKVKQASSTAAPPSKAQGTLRAFFRTTSADKPALSEPVATASVPPSLFDEANSSLNDVALEGKEVSHTATAIGEDVIDEDDDEAQMESSTDTRDLTGTEMEPKNDSDLTEAVEKRINSSEQWGKLMRKPKIPLCEDHEEPCKSFQTKKKGSNCGRIFYICARPLGPSGDKERNTQWRCRTFIWASDWQGGANGSP